MPKDFTRELDAFDRKLRASGYEPLKPFFVLKEAKIQDERTGGHVILDKARLQRVADIQNERIATTGDATPIIIGHTKRGLLEKDQPAVTGLATRFEVAKFGKVWGLQATPWTTPANKINFEKFPRRSCEFWTDPDLIDPISLLGANTPRLDLGLHQLSRDQQLASNLGYTPRLPLTLEMSAMPDDETEKGGGGDSGKPATPGNVSAAQGTETSEFAQLKAIVQQMQQQMSLLQPLFAELQADPSMGGGGMPPGGGGGPPGAGAGPGGPPPAPIQAMGTPPGGGNTMMPQQFGRQDGPTQFQHVGFGADGQPLFRQVPVAAPVQQPLQFNQWGQMPTPQQALFTPPMPMQAQATTQQSENEQLRLQVAQLQLARLGDEVNMILNDLDTKIVIDRQKDYNYLIKLEKPQRDEAIQFMLATRKTKEAPLPPEALPLQFHAQPPQMQMPAQQNVPIQLGGMEAAYMPGDPNMGRAAPGAPRAVSTHDALMEIVRNRGKMSSTDAFEQAMHAARNGSPQGIPVR